MKNIFLLFLLLTSVFVTAQDMSFFQASLYEDYCNPFKQVANQGIYTSWLPSHGSPSINYINQPNAFLRSGDDAQDGGTAFGSEGIFVDFEFLEGETYELTLGAEIINGISWLFHAKLANGLTITGNNTCYWEGIPVIFDFQELDVDTDFIAAPGNADLYQTLSFTPDADYESFWIHTDDAFHGEFEVSYVNIIQTSSGGGGSNACSAPEPATTINGNANYYVNMCYGDPFIFSGTATVEGCDYDGFLIEVDEWGEGSNPNHIASHYYDEGVTIPTSLNLYDFVDLYSDWWGFQGGKEYRVKLATWVNTPHPDPAYWRETVQHVFFTPSNAEVEFVNVDAYTPKASSLGWVVDVADVCSENIYIDASASSCFDQYTIRAEKFNIYEWEATSEAYTTGPIANTTAYSQFNLNDLEDENGNPVEFDFYDTYRVVVTTRFPYDASESLFFRRLPISDAEIDGEFEKVLEEEIIYSPGIKDDYLLSTICSKGGAYTFLADGTECEEGYRIRVEKFNPDSWTSNDNQASDTQWQLGSLPDELNIVDLYGQSLAPNTIYRLHIQVKQPWSEASYIFQIPDNHLKCIREVKNDKKPIGRFSNTAIGLFPNPTLSGMATLTLDAKLNESSADLSIFRSDGRLISHEYLDGKNQIDIDLSREVPGLYFIHVKYANEVKVLKLIRQ